MSVRLQGTSAQDLAPNFGPIKLKECPKVTHFDKPPKTFGTGYFHKVLFNKKPISFLLPFQVQTELEYLTSGMSRSLGSWMKRKMKRKVKRKMKMKRKMAHAAHTHAKMVLLNNVPYFK